MSSIVICPDCQRKLKVPEAMAGKTVRCPACKAVIPPVDEPEDAPSSHAVKTAPSPRTAAAPPRRPIREEESEEDIEPKEDLELEEEEPLREKRPRKKKSIRKKSSTGLIIGLVVGGLFLLLLVGGGVGFLVYKILNKTIPASEWQAFSPPNSGFTLLMPGSPALQTRNIAGISAQHYKVERQKENATFEVAFFDLPLPALPASILDDMVKGARENVLALMKGQVLSETSITLGNIPGREFQLKPPGRGTFIARIYLAKMGGTHRVFMVMVGGDSIQPNKGDAARFYDSFQLDASASPPTYGGAGMGGDVPPPPVINPPQPNPLPNPPRPNPGRRMPKRQRPVQ